MLKCSNKEIPIHSIFVWVVLLTLIVGGSILIMHDPSWTMDDATIIQSTVGSGKMMHVWDEPGFQPKAGRLFPLAYMHTNLVLLYTDGYIGAKPLFVINIIMWVGFVLLLFFLCHSILKERFRNQMLVEWLSLLAVLVICQRTFYNFTVLWTTISVDCLLSLLFCVVFFQYLKSERMKKWLYGVGALMTLAYFSFCCETNVILPFAIVLGMIFAKKWKDFVAVSSFFIVLLFFVLYGLLILPNVESFYDSSHGGGDSILSNAIKMMRLQKLLIVMFVIFAFRFYRIVVKKDVFDPFSDTLLLSSTGYTIGCFALRLNWGIYYTIPIVLALPAMLKLLDFGSVKKRVVSGVMVLAVFSFYVVKYPRLCKGVYNEKTKSSIDMTRFNVALEPEGAIVWYEDGKNPDNKWKKCHVGRSLKHLKENDNFELLSVENVGNGSVVLMPNNTSISELKNKYTNLSFIEKDEFAGFVLYRVIER